MWVGFTRIKIGSSSGLVWTRLWTLLECDIPLYKCTAQRCLVGEHKLMWRSKKADGVGPCMKGHVLDRPYRYQQRALWTHRHGLWRFHVNLLIFLPSWTAVSLNCWMRAERACVWLWSTHSQQHVRCTQCDWKLVCLTAVCDTHNGMYKHSRCEQSAFCLLTDLLVASVVTN